MMTIWPGSYTEPPEPTGQAQALSTRERHRKQLTAALTSLSNSLAGGNRVDPRTFIATGEPAPVGGVPDNPSMDEIAAQLGEAVGQAQSSENEGDEDSPSASSGGKAASNDILRAAKKGLRNGHVPRSRLDAIAGANPGGGQGYMLDVAAEAWHMMRDAAAADGVRLYYSSTYRSYATQKAAYDNYKAGNRGPGVVVAPPGRSQHGWGLAVDVSTGRGIIGKNTDQWKWLRRNAARFGFYGISSESWHWEFRGTA